MKKFFIKRASVGTLAVNPLRGDQIRVAHVLKKDAITTRMDQRQAMDAWQQLGFFSTDAGTEVSPEVLTRVTNLEPV